ncbi:histidine kinase [Streptomyces sp. NBC_01275]|uniref:sensor histidine kinase n=1 Tax=Streptomyces sp. NBC_01275 TaxID=2903807 RepID=UPI00224EE076|nr:histidine kinase [Streptomyces sp. NBC_01275]MCX4766655.1 histidine kinase [Streptomyces sp. NBC_01275]
MQGSALHQDARVEREDARRSHLALGTSTAITLAVFVAFFGVAVGYLLDERLSPARFTAGVVTLVVISCLQLAHSFPHLSPWLADRRYWTLGCQVVLTYLPFLTFAEAWLATPGFLAGSALLVLPPRWAWPTFAAAVASAGLLVLETGLGRGSLWYGTVATALTGLVVFGLSELTRLVQEAHRTRAELTRMVLEAERLRFSRDLHDLLGMSLTTIAFKCELARRLPPSKHARLHQELTEILDTTQRAFADVRAVSQTYRAMSLATEIDTVLSTLKAMGIHAVIRGDVGPLPPEIETTLATVLREGATNMLRHSRAGACVVQLGLEQGAVRMAVTNDGLVDRPATPFGGGRTGSGLTNLRERLDAVEGRLSTEITDEGWFSLTAVVPLPSQTQASRNRLLRSLAQSLQPSDSGMHDSATVA